MALTKAEEWIKVEISWWKAYWAMATILGIINNGHETIKDIKKAKIQAEQASCVAAHHRMLAGAV